MTIVIAKKFRDRIVIQSDTAISNEPSGPNVIPGRLKAIVLSPKISVAFAGAADRADFVIRRTPEILRHKGLRCMLAWLSQNTQETDVGWDNSVSYVVASHLNGAELYRVWDGRISEPLPETWIGDADAVQRFLAAESEVTRYYSDDQTMEDEDRFVCAFNELFHSSRSDADFVVRGFLINLLASPLGHCYQDTQVSFDPDPILLRAAASGQSSDWHRSPGLWTCGIFGTRYRGVSVVGALVPQAGLAFIYAPLRRCGVTRYYLLRPVPPDWHARQPEMVSRLLSELDRVAEELGGGVIAN